MLVAESMVRMPNAAPDEAWYRRVTPCRIGRGCRRVISIRALPTRTGTPLRVFSAARSRPVANRAHSQHMDLLVDKGIYERSTRGRPLYAASHDRIPFEAVIAVEIGSRSRRSPTGSRAPRAGRRSARSEGSRERRLRGGLSGSACAVGRNRLVSIVRMAFKRWLRSAIIAASVADFRSRLAVHRISVRDLQSCAPVRPERSGSALGWNGAEHTAHAVQLPHHIAAE